MNDREREELVQEVEGMTASQLVCWIKSEREKMITGQDLAIRSNNCAVNGVCPVCGDRTDPQVGPELFVRGTYREVCRECGERLNPALMLWLRKLQACWNNFYLSRGGARELAKMEAMEKKCPFYEARMAPPTPR